MDSHLVSLKFSVTLLFKRFIALKNGGAGASYPIIFQSTQKILKLNYLRNFKN